MLINVDSTVVSRILKSVLFVGVVIYVSIELLERLHTDSLVSVRVDWAFLLFGGLCGLLSIALFAVVYREAQLFVQQEARWLPAALVAWISPLGKYLPGKVGSLVGAVWIYRKLGVGASVATAVLLMSSGSALAACFLLLLPSVVMGYFLSEPLGATGILAWVVLAAGFFFAVPRLYVLPLNLLLKWAGRAPLSVVVPFFQYLRLIFLGIVQLALAGTAFWLTANAVTDVPGADWYQMTAAYTVAGVIGMFAFFAPGGLGVREGLLLLLLESVIEGPQLALTVILIRLSLTFCEVMLALLGMFLWRSMSSGQGRQG